jgi:hypothetical protein
MPALSHCAQTVGNVKNGLPWLSPHVPWGMPATFRRGSGSGYSGRDCEEAGNRERSAHAKARKTARRKHTAAEAWGSIPNLSRLITAGLRRPRGLQMDCGDTPRNKIAIHKLLAGGYGCGWCQGTNGIRIMCWGSGLQLASQSYSYSNSDPLTEKRHDPGRQAGPLDRAPRINGSTFAASHPGCLFPA